MKAKKTKLQRVSLEQLIIEKWVREKENKREHVSKAKILKIQKAVTKKLAERSYKNSHWEVRREQQLEIEKRGKKKQKLKDVDSLIDYSKLVKGLKKVK